MEAPVSGLKEPKSFAGQVVAAVTITIALIAFTLLLWHTADVILLCFAGGLFGIFLRSTMSLLTKYLKIPAGLSMLVSLLLISGLFAGAIILAAPSINDQADQFIQKFPQAMQHATQYLQHFAFARRFMAQQQPSRMLSAEVLGRIGGIFSSAFGLLGAFLIIFFVGLYGAMEPDLYRTGMLKLVPRPRRHRAGEVIDAVVASLRSWLNTRLFAMAVIGLLTVIGLMILHVPLALLLGLIAAILTFIPYIGPAASAIPAILMGLMQSPMTAVWVIVLSLITHLVEAYFLTPFIQRRTMNLSPVLAIVTQVIFGAVWGLLGMALATPLTAIGVVVTQMLYVEDVLGEEPDIAHHKAEVEK